MATVEECEAALHDLAAELVRLRAEGRRPSDLDRTLECTLTDLGVHLRGRLRDGLLVEIAAGPLPEAQIKLSLASDDLLAVTDGRLAFAAGWARGRIRVQASMLDLMRLRSLL